MSNSNNDLEAQELVRIVQASKGLSTPSEFMHIIYEYDQYILKYPDVLSAYVNRADVLQKLGLYQLALSDIEFALKEKPDFALAYCHRAFILNILGRYREGWRDFEWRFQGYVKDNTTKDWPISRWQGENLSGNTLCILAEQGLGDNIQFVRYAIEAKCRGINVAVSNRKLLGRLLNFNLKKFNIPVLGYDPTISNVGAYVHMMSLPYHFKTELESIPLSQGYIDAEPEYKEKWRQLFTNCGSSLSKLRVGIVWSGSLDHSRNRARNIDFEQISALLQLDAEFHCLQKEIAEQDIQKAKKYENLFLWNEQLVDFSDTAGLIDQLDLIITVDTSVAHLGGAMAKPTWIMVTHHPDYRWLLAREDSPWYQSVRLFRQDISMRWEPVIQRIYSALEAEILKKG